MEKSCRKCATKAGLKPLFKNSHCMREIILKIGYFERGLSKFLNHFDFVFSFELVPFNWQNYQKQKEARTSDQLQTQSRFFL